MNHEHHEGIISHITNTEKSPNQDFFVIEANGERVLVPRFCAWTRLLIGDSVRYSAGPDGRLIADSVRSQSENPLWKYRFYFADWTLIDSLMGSTEKTLP